LGLGFEKPPGNVPGNLQGFTDRFQEMAEAEACCGCGGSLTLEYYELSSAVGARKRAAILASGAEALATSFPACMRQLTDLLSKGGDPVRVKQVIELFAERLPG
jgi:glycolate oxidase iron-sulfur subunit